MIIIIILRLSEGKMKTYTHTHTHHRHHKPLNKFLFISNNIYILSTKIRHYLDHSFHISLNLNIHTKWLKKDCNLIDLLDENEAFSVDVDVV